MRTREYQEYLDEERAPTSASRLSLRGSPYLYIFLHVPKCGGTTVKHYLDAVEESFYVGRLVSFRAWSYRKREILDKLSALCGQDLHVLYGPTTFFGIHESFAKLKPHYFTVLRDPVARVLSDYRYLLSLRPTSPWGTFIHRTLRPDGAPLGFSAWQERYNWWNQMTFYLARMYTGEFLPSRAKSRIDVQRLPSVTEEDFDHARRMLDECFMILDADTLERGLRGLLEHMGNADALASQPLRLNPSHERYALTADDRELIAARNGWDARLYEHARGLEQASTLRPAGVDATNDGGE